MASGRDGERANVRDGERVSGRDGELASVREFWAPRPGAHAAWVRDMMLLRATRSHNRKGWAHTRGVVPSGPG